MCLCWLSWGVSGVSAKKTLMDYTFPFSSLKVEFCFPSPVKSALCALACILEIQFCKTTQRETLHMPERKASNANVSQTWEKELPNSVACSILAGDWFALRGVIWKHAERWHCWLRLVRKCSLCLCVFLSELGYIGDVCANSLACNANMWACLQKVSALHSIAPSGLHGKFSCFPCLSRGAEI